MGEIRLRPYQERSAADIRNAFLQGIRGVLLRSPTGSGKTVTFSYITKGAVARGNRSLILAHRDFLINQASEKLSGYGVGHGIIMGGYSPTPHAMAQVGSVQTLIRRLGKYPRDYFRLVIVDEAHLSCARTYLEIIDHFNEARILGVTGTPARLDGKGLGTGAGGRFDHMIESVTTRELIDDGYAVQPIVFAPLERLNLSQVPKSKGDFEKGALSRVMNTRVITGNAIDHYREHAMHVPTATWCVDVEHARQTCAEFNAAGIKSVMLHGKSTDDERTDALNRVSDGTIYNITFCQLLVEGVDCPALGCIIGLRPTESLPAYLQTLGRMFRPIYAGGFDLETREGRFAAMDAGPKGRKCYFLDCSGLTFRHGFADEDRDWDLMGVPKKKSESSVVAIRQCPKCWNVFPPAPICPNCGHLFETQTRELKHEEGSLGELTPEMLTGELSPSQIKRQRQIEVAVADTREALERIARERDYSPAWVNMQLRIKAAKKREKENAGGQRQLWQQKEEELMRSNPKYKLDADWPEF